MGYRIRKVDKNQPEIVKRFRELGCTVCILSSVGNGIPDALIAIPGGSTALVEIKDGSKPPSARKLTPDEQKFFDNWLGHIAVVCSEKEAEDFVNRLKSMQYKV